MKPLAGGGGSPRPASASSSASPGAPLPGRAGPATATAPVPVPAPGTSPEEFSIQDLTPEEANRIIHSHRKVRYGTACWPCRQRKVKCDNRNPCENCVKREHPQLCQYKPNRGATTTTAAAAAAAASSSTSKSPTAASRKRARSPTGSDGDGGGGGGRGGRRVDFRKDSWPRGVMPNLDDTEPGELRYMGQNSIPALLREQSSPADRDRGHDFRQDMQAIFGLDSSAPFPLMSPRHLERLTQDVTAELPLDREVIKLFRTYKETPQPFWGFVVDVDDLESRLMVHLEDRARNARSSVKTGKPVSASWMAILFAVMAVGSQYHESPYDVRTRDSQKYIQIAFHFLRAGNFLLRPTFDSIQALLLTCFVLLNDMKAEASWALLGLTCRLAQSLGLHRPHREDGRESVVPPDSRSKEMVRRKLWWTCVWHDTLISLSFDRSPMTSFASCPIPVAAAPSPSRGGDGLSYLEAMYHLIEIISRRLNPDATANITYAQMLDNCEAVETLRGRISPGIWQKDLLRTATDRLQHFALRLHTAFVVSVCCRPALRKDCPRLEPAHKQLLAGRCKANLTETVRMFLAMHQQSVIPTRSWAFTYHGLSSALLLGILPETRSDPEVRQLQGDLIEALSATADKDRSSTSTGGGGGGTEPRADRDIELSGPLFRALAALKNIYDHGQIVGTSVKRETDSTGSGSKSPLPSFSALVQQQQQQSPAPPFQGMHHPGGGDPHQDAALAMAEMQNGASLPDLSSLGGLSYPPDGGVNLDALAGLDATAYLNPMDVYESIWWESPEPLNNGVDPMNFDFMARPPPGQGQQQFYF